jgi:hypothetical protein
MALHPAQGRGKLDRAMAIRFEIERLDPRLAEVYRKAAPEQKLAAVARLNGTLIDLKRAYLRSTRPDLNPAQLQAELRQWWFSARK